MPQFGPPRIVLNSFIGPAGPTGSVGPTLSSSIDAANYNIYNTKIVTFTSEFDNGASGNAKTIDWRVAQKQKIDITGATAVLSFTPPYGVSNLLLRIVQDATGGRFITWPASVKWAGAVAPVLSTASGAMDIVTLYYNSSSYFGVASLNFA